MGGFADAIVKYAQPLIDSSDGSPEQVQNALTMSQLCWNMALMSEEDRNAFLDKMPPMPNMGIEVLEEFKRTVVKPMVQRHQEMFPGLHRGRPIPPANSTPIHEIPRPAPRRPVKKYAGTGRNEPCPCGSGKKYKLCCGR